MEQREMITYTDMIQDSGMISMKHSMDTEEMTRLTDMPETISCMVMKDKIRFTAETEMTYCMAEPETMAFTVKREMTL